jgi:hypothetical protein
LELKNPMKTFMLALVVVSMAVIIPGAADAHIGTTTGCYDYSVYNDPFHTHFCVNIQYVIDLVTGTLA